MSISVQQLASDLQELCGTTNRRIQLMEVCGTHTVTIFRSGIRALLPENLRLVSGPGCPVCVTAQRHIDAAIELAMRPGVLLATYGDMLRVPGRRGSLEQLRAQGADIRVVNSARTALDLATRNPDRPVVFLGVGFETTAPATAAIVIDAEREEIDNLSVVMCHKLVVPAMRALLEAGDVPLDGFLAPGHVSVIIGAGAYRPIAEQYRRPVVVAGFEPEQILGALLVLVQQVIREIAVVENMYTAAVTGHGNRIACNMMARVCVVADAVWRELGVIPQSGLELAPKFRKFDALERFGVQLGEDEKHPLCRCGEVIMGKVDPPQCAAFGTACNPLNPIGPCMVSSEGTCSAWYKYGRVSGPEVSAPSPATGGSKPAAPPQGETANIT